ncbi:MAG: hypothetical protein Q9159_004890 [Coniocarpon cinnabarinum]
MDCSGLPALPALHIFFANAPYEKNIELHETFWSSHLARVAHSGILLGARQDGQWRGFRCFFKPDQGRDAYDVNFRLDEGNEDWDRFLQLAGKEQYEARVREWGRVAGETNRELGLETSGCYKTSIIVVE